MPEFSHPCIARAEKNICIWQDEKRRHQIIEIADKKHMDSSGGARFYHKVIEQIQYADGAYKRHITNIRLKIMLFQKRDDAFDIIPAETCISFHYKMLRMRTATIIAPTIDQKFIPIPPLRQ